MKYFSPFLLFICLLFNFSKLEAQQDKDLQKFYNEKLKANGVIAPAEILSLPYQDIERVASVNFDDYREYSVHRMVQLERGPKVELLSLQEMVALGHAVSPALIQRKKDVVINSAGHVVMPLINAGIGVRTARVIGEKR